MHEFPNYKERPLVKANWVAGYLVKHQKDNPGFIRDVSVFYDPNDQDVPDTDYISAWVRTTIFAGEKETDAWREIFLRHIPADPEDEDSIEILDVDMPLSGVRAPDDFVQFRNEAVSAWHTYIDQTLLPEGFDADWRITAPGKKPVHRDNTLVQIGIAESSNIAKKPGELRLEFENAWAEYSPEDYAGLSREEYVLSVLTAFARSYRFARISMAQFVIDEFPRLQNLLKDRLEHKEPGFLGQWMRQQPMAEWLGSFWDKPDLGTEPFVELASYVLGIPYRESRGDKTDNVPIIGIHNTKSDSLIFGLYITDPDVVKKIASDDEEKDFGWRQYLRYCNGQGHDITLQLFPETKGLKSEMMGFVLLGPREQPDKLKAVVMGIMIDRHQIEMWESVGHLKISREMLMIRTLELIKQLYPYWKMFTGK